MAKTVVDMTPQELIKMLSASFGELIDARIRTAEITIKANTDAAIKAAEERIRKDMATKQDVARLEQKLDTKLQDHDERIKALEEPTAINQKN